MNAGEDPCLVLACGPCLLPGACGAPRVRPRRRESRGRAGSPCSPVSLCVFLAGAGYGSYGYGGNSATAGYSKCVFLFV